MVVGFTVTLPLTSSAPAGTPVPVKVTEVAFTVVQERTTGAPEAGEDAGFALNEVI